MSDRMSRTGFEPVTCGLGNRCSILLSYRDENCKYLSCNALRSVSLKFAPPRICSRDNRSRPLCPKVRAVLKRYDNRGTHTMLTETKPNKPCDRFPLTAYRNGQWCKKIRGGRFIISAPSRTGKLPLISFWSSAATFRPAESPRGPASNHIWRRVGPVPLLKTAHGQDQRKRRYREDKELMELLIKL